MEITHRYLCINIRSKERGILTKYEKIYVVYFSNYLYSLSDESLAKNKKVLIMTSQFIL